MTIDRTYPVFYSAMAGCSRPSCTYRLFLGSISAMQFIQR